MNNRSPFLLRHYFKELTAASSVLKKYVVLTAGGVLKKIYSPEGMKWLEVLSRI